MVSNYMDSIPNARVGRGERTAAAAGRAGLEEEGRKRGLYKAATSMTIMQYTDCVS